MLDTIYSQIAVVVLLGVCAFAFWKGERLEQVGAAAFLLGSLATIFSQDDAGTATPKIIWLAIDSGLMAVFAGLAWKSVRSWPLFATAFQAIAVFAHLMSMAHLEIGAFAYVSAVAISGYGVLGSLAVGTWNAWREREALNYTPL